MFIDFYFIEKSWKHIRSYEAFMCGCIFLTLKMSVEQTLYYLKSGNTPIKCATYFSNNTDAKCAVCFRGYASAKCETCFPGYVPVKGEILPSHVQNSFSLATPQ